MAASERAESQPMCIRGKARCQLDGVEETFPCTRFEKVASTINLLRAEGHLLIFMIFLRKNLSVVKRCRLDQEFEPLGGAKHTQILSCQILYRPTPDSDPGLIIIRSGYILDRRKF